MRNDYTGQRYGRLVFVAYSHSDGRSAWWRCRCDCGQEVVMRSQNVRNPNNRSCGCHRNKRGLGSNAFRGSGVVGSSFLSYVRTRAKFKGLELDNALTVEYLSDLFNAQGGRCALSGECLRPPENYRTGWTKTTNMSLDRIDSSRGYVVGNVQWVTKQVNFMKQSFSQQEFIDMCYKVVEFNKAR